jgi:peptide/nickel transport system permease protein
MSSLVEPYEKLRGAIEPQTTVALRAQPNRLAALARFFRQKPLGALGALMIAVFVLMAVFADEVAPFPYDQCAGCPVRIPPSPQYVFGTDNLGRDIFSRIVWGSRISVSVGFGAVAIGTGLAAILGILSGYWGGRFDLILQRFIDVWISIPALVLVIFLVSVFTTRNTDALTSIELVAITIGLVVAAGSTRVVRSAVLAIRHQPYMEAARCIGCRDERILRCYVLPNVFATILILATTQLGTAILAEATIAFLGYGVKPPMPAWGSMLSGTARSIFLLAPWMAVFPGLAISLAVFGFNMLGDALRDVLDPRLRGSR